MKKILLPLLLFISTSSLLIPSCSKKSDDPAYTKENLAGTYILISYKAGLNGMPEEDVTDTYFESCELDDQYTLHTDGSYDYVDAGTACDPNGSDSGTWTLSGNTINIDGIEGNISQFDGTNLVVKGSIQQSGVTYTFTVTFKKQS